MTDTLPTARTAAPPLLSVVYSSVATTTFSDTDLAMLLTESRMRNTSRELTGLLLSRDGRFMQVLEGPEPTVRRVLATIAADPRHAELRVLDEEDIEERRFATWAMGYRSMTDSEVARWFGSAGPRPASPEGRTAALLQAFREG